MSIHLFIYSSLFFQDGEVPVTTRKIKFKRRRPITWIHHPHGFQGHSSVELWAWINYRIHVDLRDVITHACYNFMGRLAQLLLKLIPGWVIISNVFYVITNHLPVPKTQKWFNQSRLLKDPPFTNEDKVICHFIMTSSNGNIFGVAGPLCGEFAGHRWIPRIKASDTELWCFLWSAPE